MQVVETYKHTHPFMQFVKEKIPEDIRRERQTKERERESRRSISRLDYLNFTAESFN